MATSINTSRTIYGAYLQDCLFTRRPWTMKKNTTLNEKLDINKDVPPDNNAYPFLGYWCIGDKGGALTTGNGGRVQLTPLPHRGSDAAPFSIIPFVLRPVANDLDVNTQKLYALRKLIAVNGNNYFAYYLRRIDYSNINPEMLYTNVVNGVASTSAFVPDTSNLNPEPPALNPDGSVSTTGDYLSVSEPVALVLQPSDIAELMNVAQVLYGSSDASLITEIAMCTGMDKVMSSPDGANGSISFNEAVGVQVAGYASAGYMIPYLQEGITVNMNVGTAEPLFLYK